MRALAQLAQHVLHPILEHAAQHRTGHHAVHLQVDHLAVAQPQRHRLRIELEAPGQPLDDGRLADAGLADEDHRVGPLAVAEDLDDLLDLFVAAVHGRQLVLLGQQVQVDGEMLQERRQLEALAEPLVAQLDVAHARGDPRHEPMRIDRLPPQDRRRQPLGVLEDRREQIGRVERRTAGAARVMERQLAQQLGRRRHLRLVPRPGGGGLQLPLHLDHHRTRVQVEVAHDLRVQFPLDLREAQEHVLVGEQRLLTPARFVQRTVEHALGTLANLARSDIEFVDVHGALPSRAPRKGAPDGPDHPRWPRGG